MSYGARGGGEGGGWGTLVGVGRFEPIYMLGLVNRSTRGTGAGSHPLVLFTTSEDLHNTYTFMIYEPPSSPT